MFVRGELPGRSGLVCVKRTEAGDNVLEAYVNGTAVRVSVPRTGDLQPPSVILVNNGIYSENVVLIDAAAAAGVADVCERIYFTVVGERCLKAYVVLEDVDYFGDVLGYSRGCVGGCTAAGREGAISVDICRIKPIRALFYSIGRISFYGIDFSISYFYNDANMLSRVRPRGTEDDEIAGDGGISACAGVVGHAERINGSNCRVFDDGGRNSSLPCTPAD